MDLKPKLNHNLTQSQKEIMRRVRVISFVYSFVNSPLCGVVVVLSLVFVSGLIVSFDHVLVNTLAYTDWSSRFSYDLTSFEHTQVIVQILAACITLAAAYSLINSVRTIRRTGFFSLFMVRRMG